MRTNCLCQGWQDRSIADNRGQPVRDQICQLLVEECSQHDDGSRETGLTECDPFLKRGDGKPSDPLACKGVSNLNGSMPIGIGLDDGHDLAAGREIALDAREIVGECREIDSGVGG